MEAEQESNEQGFAAADKCAPEDFEACQGQVLNAVSLDQPDESYEFRVLEVERKDTPMPDGFRTPFAVLFDVEGDEKPQRGQLYRLQLEALGPICLSISPVSASVEGQSQVLYEAILA